MKRITLFILLATSVASNSFAQQTAIDPKISFTTKSTCDGCLMENDSIVITAAVTGFPAGTELKYGWQFEGLTDFIQIPNTNTLTYTVQYSDFAGKTLRYGFWVKTLPDTPGNCSYFKDIRITKCEPLALRITRFSAWIENNKAMFDWSVEEATSVYLEKKAEGDNSWTTIPVIGTTYTDQQFSKTTLYRLKVMDIAGTEKYSNTIPLRKVNMQQTFLVELMNAAGQTIQKLQKIQYVSSIEALKQRMQVQNLPSGVYFLKMMQGSTIQTDRFVK